MTESICITCKCILSRCLTEAVGNLINFDMSDHNYIVIVINYNN